MKTSNVYQLIILSLFILAATCDPKVKFENPQPEGRKDLIVIPGKYIGTYREVSDSTNLIINETMITKEELRIARLTKAQLWAEMDTVFEMDTTVNIFGNMTVDFDFYDDSVQLTTYNLDTLFDLNNQGILRQYKGYVFLNSPLENDFWKVKIIKTKGDSLLFRSLISESEIDTIRPLTEVITIKDSVEHKPEEYRLNPSKSEMKKILSLKAVKYNYKKIEVLQ